MGTLITYVMGTITYALKTFAHGLGTIPDYIVVESLTDTNTTGLEICVVTYDSTSFTLLSSIGDTPFKATVIKTHSIVA